MERRSNYCEAADNVFGPRIYGCRDSFDFTLLFEQSILSMLPSLILLVVAVPQLLCLLKEANKIHSRPTDWLILAKLTAICCYVATQIALIIIYASSSSDPTHLSIAASCCSLCATLAIAVLSYLGHRRSERPSFTLTIYLLFTTLFDVCQARTLWLRKIDPLLPGIFTAGLALKAAILFLETIEKRALLRTPYRYYSPEALGGIINRSVFWWLNSLLFNGSSKILRQEDLFPLDPELSASSFITRFRKTWSTCDKTNDYALVLATYKTFCKPLLLIIFPRICLIGFTIAQPLLINRAISLLSQPDSVDKTNVGRALIGATALIYLGIAISTAFYQHQIYRCITMIRGGLVTLVYDATLKLHSSKATDAAAVTHMSTDIDQITQGMTNFDVLWAAPIEVGLAIYILWREIGLACLAPVGIAVGCTLAAFLLGKLSRKAQRVWVNAVQLRTTATVSMLNNIKGIRMSGLSSRFSTNIQDLRVKELAASKSYRHLTVLKNTIGTLPQVMGPVTAFVIYVLVRQNSNSRLDPATAFTSLSLITLLSSPIFLFMFALPPFTASIACYDRIQKYLLSADDETNGSSLGDIKKSDGVPSTNYPDTESNMMELKTKHSMQDEGNDLVILDRASFSFENQGPAVLHDISFSIQKGNLVMLTGAVGSGKSTLLLAILGECFQVGGTLRRSPILRIGYCGQTPWLRNLSVRQIIQGASPFDKDWYAIVLNACVLEPDLAILPEGDQTVIGSRGTSLSGGQKQRLSLARALYAKKHLLLLDDITSGLDATTVQILTQRVFGPDGLCRRHHMSVLLATHDVRLMYFMDSIMALSPEGRIIHRGPPSIVNSGDEVCSSPQSEDDSLHKTSEPEQSSNREKDAALADLARKVGDWRLYLYYFNTMGWALTAIFIMVSIAFTFCYNFPTIWLQLWSESESSHPGEHQVMYLVVYAVLGILAIILMSASVWVLIVEMVPRSSIKLHKMLLDTVLSAPFSFFISTDTGVTLNRFSQDMSLIDMQLPFGFLQAVDGVFECIAAAVLIAVSSYWTALSFPVLILILYVLQKFYLSTSRQMRFLDLEAKSPLYSHFLDTLHGLVTIRAFGWHSEFQETNQKLLNDSQKPYYLMFSIQRWLNLVLDLVVTAIAVTIVAIASQVHGLSSAGALGVALSNIVSFSRILTYLIQAWTQMETSIGAISRLKSFTEETSSEHLPEEVIVPKGFWPSRGAIQFRSLTSGYGAQSSPILKDITVNIEPGSKVGICGRSGSGKSSLILSILRMTDIHGGTITIDGIDLATLSRESVREKLNVMPQDAMILSGSVRFNIDPSGKKSDEEILSALAEVGLLDLIESRGGLSSTLDASALSSGQQQLICLTRALINPSRILILDEATSNVDQETETKMVKLIQDRFRGCTVVAVAHRLRTIRDFDVILVLDQGRVLEYGRPDDLLQIPGSRFRELWESQR